MLTGADLVAFGERHKEMMTVLAECRQAAIAAATNVSGDFAQARRYSESCRGFVVAFQHLLSVVIDQMPVH